ncbi:unnamed protein product, partial [marine sediment metagenome]
GDNTTLFFQFNISDSDTAEYYNFTIWSIGTNISADYHAIFGQLNYDLLNDGLFSDDNITWFKYYFSANSTALAINNFTFALFAIYNYTLGYPYPHYPWGSPFLPITKSGNIYEFSDVEPYADDFFYSEHLYRFTMVLAYGNETKFTININNTHINWTSAPIQNTDIIPDYRSGFLAGAEIRNSTTQKPDWLVGTTTNLTGYLYYPDGESESTQTTSFINTVFGNASVLIPGDMIDQVGTYQLYLIWTNSPTGGSNPDATLIDQAGVVNLTFIISHNTSLIMVGSQFEDFTTYIGDEPFIISSYLDVDKGETI